MEGDIPVQQRANESKFWHCKKCGQVNSIEMAVCDCGFSQSENDNASFKYAPEGVQMKAGPERE